MPAAARGMSGTTEGAGVAGRDPLVERWLTPEGAGLAGAVADALRRGRPLTALGLGEVEGRVDLRGLRWEMPKEKGRIRAGSIEATVVEGRTTLEKARLERLDLSGAFLPSLLLERCTVRDCVFDRASCQRISIFGGEVADTSFAHADLRSAAPLGAWIKREGTAFRHCSFARADLRGTSTGVADFVDCDFSYAKLDKVEFHDAGFVRCRFAGHLRGVLFYVRGWNSKRRGDNPFSGNDFGASTLEYAAFYGLDLSDCVLPSAPGHLVLRHWHCAMDKAVRLTAGDPAPAAQLVNALATNYLHQSGPSVRVNVVAESDFDDARDFAVDLLTRLDAECGG